MGGERKDICLIGLWVSKLSGRVRKTVYVEGSTLHASTVSILVPQVTQVLHTSLQTGLLRKRNKTQSSRTRLKSLQSMSMPLSPLKSKFHRICHRLLVSIALAKEPHVMSVNPKRSMYAPEQEPTYHAYGIQHAAQLYHRYKEYSALFTKSSSGESRSVDGRASHPSTAFLTQSFNFLR